MARIVFLLLLGASLSSPFATMRRKHKKTEPEPAVDDGRGSLDDFDDVVTKGESVSPTYSPFTPGDDTAFDGATGSDPFFCTNVLAFAGDGVSRLTTPDQTKDSNSCGTITTAEECGEDLANFKSGSYFMGTDSRFYPCTWNSGTSTCAVAPNFYYACHPLCVGGASGNGTGFPSPPPPPPSPSPPPARRELESDAKKSGAKNSRKLSGVCTSWREGYENGTLKNLKGSWNSAGKKNCGSFQDGALDDDPDECVKYYRSDNGVVNNEIKFHMCEHNGNDCVQGGPASYGDCVVDPDLVTPTCSGCPTGAAHLCEPGTSAAPLCVITGSPTTPFPNPIPDDFTPTCPTNAPRGNWMQNFLSCTSGASCSCTVSNAVEQWNSEQFMTPECTDVPACNPSISTQCITSSSTSIFLTV